MPTKKEPHYLISPYGGRVFRITDDSVESWDRINGKWILDTEANRPKKRKQFTEKALESIAMQFHSHYEELAPKFDIATKIETRVKWNQLPKSQKDLMIATVASVFKDGFPT